MTPVLMSNFHAVVFMAVFLCPYVIGLAFSSSFTAEQIPL